MFYSLATLAPRKFSDFDLELELRILRLLKYLDYLGWDGVGRGWGWDGVGVGRGWGGMDGRGVGKQWVGGGGRPPVYTVAYAAYGIYFIYLQVPPNESRSQTFYSVRHLPNSSSWMPPTESIALYKDEYSEDEKKKSLPAFGMQLYYFNKSFVKLIV